MADVLPTRLTMYPLFTKYGHAGPMTAELTSGVNAPNAAANICIKSIHPVTGLNPDYNNYDGSLLGNNRIIGDAFRFDSWRVPMNIALDYSWACADKEWQQEYGNKIQNFLYSQGIDTFVDQYNVDGTQVKRHPPGRRA